MTEDWVTVATFTMPYEAHLLRLQLEDEGISCFIRDEEMVSANPLYSHAIGGVKVQVQRSDLGKALAALGVQRRRGHLTLQCPQCGSQDTERHHAPWMPVFISLILNPILLLLFSRRWRCNLCHCVFKEESSGIAERPSDEGGDP